MIRVFSEGVQRIFPCNSDSLWRTKWGKRTGLPWIYLSLLLQGTMVQAQPSEVQALGPYQHTVPATLNNYAISWWMERKQDPQTALILLDRALRIVPDQNVLRQNRDVITDMIRQGKMMPEHPENPAGSAVKLPDNITNGHMKLEGTGQGDVTATPDLEVPSRWDAIPETTNPSFKENTAPGR